MKKIIILLGIIMIVLFFQGRANAADEPAGPDGFNWEISVQPKPTEEEKEAARWSFVTQNNLGIYAYDMESISFGINAMGMTDRDIVDVLVKTLFTDKKVLGNLKRKYAKKLEKKERVLYCLMNMEFNIRDKTYAVRKTAVFTDKNRQIDENLNNGDFAPVPKGTFAEAMLEVCQKFAADTR